MAKNHVASCQGCGRDASAFSELCAPCSVPGISHTSDQSGRKSAYEGQNGRGAYDGDTAIEFDESLSIDSRNDSHLTAYEPVAGERFDPVLRAIAQEEAEADPDEVWWEELSSAGTSLPLADVEPPDFREDDWNDFDPYDLYFDPYDLYDDYEDHDDYSQPEGDDLDPQPVSDEEIEALSNEPHVERDLSERRGHRHGDPGIGGNRHRPGRKLV